MFEFTRDWLSQGVGVSTFALALHVPAYRQVCGTSISKQVITMKDTTPSTKYVALADIPAVLASTERQLLSVSPHPDDRCCTAISVQNLMALPIELIRTRGRQGDVEDADLTAVAEKERAEGEAAAAIATKLGKSAQKLDGETYVAELIQSPDAQLTRDAIKSIRRSTPAVALGPGVSLGQSVEDFPHEIPCDGNQVLVVNIRGVIPKPLHAIARVVDPRDHAQFWAYFDDREFEIEIVDDSDALTLKLASAIEMEMEIEISPTVTLPRGALKHDRVRAGLCRSLDHTAVANAVMRRLKQQLKLDF